MLGDFPLIVHPINIHAGGAAILRVILVFDVNIDQIAVDRAAVYFGAVLRIVLKGLAEEIQNGLMPSPTNGLCCL